MAITGGFGSLADANVFKRSWEVTKITFSVMLKNKKMFWFVVLDDILSLMSFLPLVIVALIAAGLIGPDMPVAPLFAIAMLVGYFLSYIFTVFFDVCTVYTAKREFSGEHANTGSILGFAFSRLPRIIMWALFSGTVGLLLKAVKKRKGRGISGILSSLAGGLLSMAWSIVTVFVIPEIVYRDSRPITAIKNSFNTVKQTWGELLIRWFGLNVIQSIVSFISFASFGLLGFTAFEMGMIGLMISAIVGFILVQVLIVATFAIANQVYDTALYEYAHTGRVPGSYSEEMLKDAFKDRRSVRRF